MAVPSPPPENPIEVFRKLLLLQGQFARTLSKALHEADAPLSLEEYDIMVTIEYEPNHRMRMSDLAEKVALTRSGVTRAVKRLVARGFLERKPCPEDGRGIYAILTPSGQRAREASFPPQRQVIEQHFVSQLTQDELAWLETIFDRIHKSVKP